MSTRKERLDALVKLIEDPIAEVSFKETCKLFYHATRYEFLLVKHARIEDKICKHGDILNDRFKIANFQHQLQKL